MMTPVHEPNATRHGDRLLILAAALLFSTGGAAVKLCSISSWQVACLRSGIAALALFLMLPSARRGWSWRTVLVGSAYALTMITYVVSNKLTTSANAIFLQSTAPFYVLLLGPLLLGEPLRRRNLLFMAALAAGFVLIFGGPQTLTDTAPDPLRGNFVAAAAGVFWALTIVGLRWLGRAGPGGASNAAASATICGNAIAALVSAPLALPIVGATATDWGSVVFLGVFQIALAYVFMIRGVRTVGALEVSLLVLLEPVLNPVWSWWVHGEQPSTRALLGGTVIIVATALHTWAASRAGRSRVTEIARLLRGRRSRM
jgi:drug/metabolite transporter (DMT)-like permease